MVSMKEGISRRKGSQPLLVTKHLLLHTFLALFSLAILACGPADEPVQREIGNLPSTAPQAEEATATPIPASSLVPVEKCITLNPEMVELVDEEYREQGEDGVWRQCDMYWPEPTPDATLIAKKVPDVPAVQQYRYLKELGAIEEARDASGDSGESIHSPYGADTEADSLVNRRFFFESEAETATACAWLLDQMGETLETTKVGCDSGNHSISGRIPASLLEGLVDHPGYKHSLLNTEYDTPGDP